MRGGDTIHQYIIREFRGTSLANSSHGGTSISTLPFIANIPSKDKNLFTLGLEISDQLYYPTEERGVH